MSTRKGVLLLLVEAETQEKALLLNDDRFDIITMEV
jgi:hypothetical protein